MPLSAHTHAEIRAGLGILLVALLLSIAFAARAEGEDPATIEKITTLNKKALDQYNNLEFEEARKLLKQALDLCSASGLDKHPIKARTHIHMGVVLIAAKQQELGVKQFRKALEIQPDIQVTKAMANPEIIQAFEEAGAGGPAPPSGSGTETSTGVPDPSGAEPGGPPPPETTGDDEEGADIKHVPVARSRKGKPITITVSVSPDLTGYTKVVLAYQPEGTEDFLTVDMQRSGNKFTAQIPGTATEGDSVAYFIDAEAADETVVASSGTEEAPHAVSLSDEEEAEDEGDEESGPPFFLGVLGGLGVGYATGNGEVNVLSQVSAGFAPSSAGQIAVEAGYFLTPVFRLSLQMRYQMITGTTPVSLDKFMMVNPTAPVNLMECGSDRLCYTVNNAVAVFARGSWFFGSGTFRPYFSLAVGGGQIRHVVSFTSLNKICGTKGDQTCVDTVLAGPIFAGPGGGALITITPNVGIIVEVNSVLGFPKFTYHLDFNGGVAARF